MKEIKESTKPNEVVIMGDFNYLQLVKCHSGTERKGSNFSLLRVNAFLEHVVPGHTNGMAILDFSDAQECR